MAFLHFPWWQPESTREVCSFDVACDSSYAWCTSIRLGETLNPTFAKKKKTGKKKRLLELVILAVCAKLAEVGLKVCEHAGKVKSYPGRPASSHCSQQMYCS